MSAAKLTAWRARHVGFIFQMYNLIPVLTAFENVELPLLLTRLSKAAAPRSTSRRRSRVVGLADRMHHYPRQLSGGQEQRVAIARAIVADPTFLLADEPTGDLDRKSADEIMELLERLVHEHGKTVLMVTHDPRAAERAHAVLHLDKGVLVEGARARGRRMKYLRLVWANLLRKKIRTTLTIGSFAVALFLFGLLVAIQVAFYRRRRTSPAPTGCGDQQDVADHAAAVSPTATGSLQIPGVSGVTFATWFGGVYQDERNFFPQFAVDTDTWFDVYPEYVVPERAAAGVPAPTAQALRRRPQPGEALRLEGRRPHPAQGHDLARDVGVQRRAAIYDGEQPGGRHHRRFCSATTTSRSGGRSARARWAGTSSSSRTPTTP